MNNENKPREFWIDEETRQLKHCQKLVHTVRLVKPSPCEFNGRDPIHVIEFEAYEDLKNECSNEKSFGGWKKRAVDNSLSNKKLIAENSALIEIIREQQKALEFYGDRYNWNKVYGDKNSAMCVMPDNDWTYYTAGKKARATLTATSDKLKELNIELGDK